MAVGERFASIWSGAQASLGCPLGSAIEMYGAGQSFERGYMLWTSEDSRIHVLLQDGRAASYADTFQDGVDPETSNLSPPAGLLEPKRGFGKVWRDNSNVRSGLGWATTEERGFHGSSQRFEHGLMLWSDVRGIFALYSDGRWEHYN